VGAKIEISGDALASKTFFMAVLAALLYISVVFAFVIGGNRAEENAMEPVHAARAAEGQGHHP
jgi:hypothetical protein